MTFSGVAHGSSKTRHLAKKAQKLGTLGFSKCALYTIKLCREKLVKLWKAGLEKHKRCTIA